MQPEVSIDAGRVRGETKRSVYRFLGLSYAEAPFGSRRFGAPEPAAAWDAVRYATRYGASAPQPEQGFTVIPEPIIPGDDCLNLNVFTPELGPARLPVLVWIHGGGFVNGCNASPWYDGKSFARDGIVVVAINYRPGIEGAGLFRGAIMMSGAASYDASEADSARLVAAIANDLGVAPTRNGLGSADRAHLIDAQHKLARGGTGMRFAPIFDGDLVPAAPLERIRAGTGADIPPSSARSTVWTCRSRSTCSTPRRSASSPAKHRPRAWLQTSTDPG